MEDIINKIRDVWGGYDDFEEGGYEYVAFIIQNDIDDMEEDTWDEKECIEELADVCINAMRKMDEEGYDVEDVIEQRIEDHEDKGQEGLVSKYQRLFEEG
jgi:septation ring formation regulator EzrA